MLALAFQSLILRIPVSHSSIHYYCLVDWRRFFEYLLLHRQYLATKFCIVHQTKNSPTSTGNRGLGMRYRQNNGVFGDTTRGTPRVMAAYYAFRIVFCQLGSLGSGHKEHTMLQATRKNAYSLKTLKLNKYMYSNETKYVNLFSYHKQLAVI